jgi:hypothetical protein
MLCIFSDAHKFGEPVVHLGHSKFSAWVAFLLPLISFLNHSRNYGD